MSMAQQNIFTMQAAGSCARQTCCESQALTSKTSSSCISFSALSPVVLLQELLCAQYVQVSGQPPVFMLSRVQRCTCKRDAYGKRAGR